MGCVPISFARYMYILVYKNRSTNSESALCVSAHSNLIPQFRNSFLRKEFSVSILSLQCSVSCTENHSMCSWNLHIVTYTYTLRHRSPRSSPKITSIFQLDADPNSRRRRSHHSLRLEKHPEDSIHLPRVYSHNFSVIVTIFRVS